MSGPGEIAAAFLLTPWSSAWFAGNTLDGAVLLATAGLGASIAFRAGSFNLGGEGQVYLGGFVASLVLLVPLPVPAPLLLLVAALAAMAAGAAMAGLSGILKRAAGADEMISTFLVSAALSPLLDHLISGPLRDSSASLLAMPRIEPGRLLVRLLPPSGLNFSAILLLLLILTAWLVLTRHTVGFRLRVAGANPRFAAYAGIDAGHYLSPALATSGALHALAGFFAVAGSYGLCHRGFSGGLGWNAIAVALIARNRPLLLLPVSVAYAWLLSGSRSALLGTDLAFGTAGFIQALVLILVTARFFGRKG